MKNYIKPAISFQSLSMSTAVSDTCNTTGTQDPNSCPVPIPGFGGQTVFATNNECDFEADDMNTGSICYHGPTGIISVFGS